MFFKYQHKTAINDKRNMSYEQEFSYLPGQVTVSNLWTA